MGKVVITLLSNIVDYVNQDGVERKDFVNWMCESQPKIIAINHCDKFEQTYALIIKGEDVDEDEVDNLARNIQLFGTDGCQTWTGHIYPLLLQLESSLEAEQKQESNDSVNVGDSLLIINSK